MREDWSTLRKLMFQRMAAGGSLKEYEVEGNPAVFQTNVAKPLSGFTIPFLPVQSGTGDPSPENIRPISGWSGVTANRAGKNLVNVDGQETQRAYINNQGEIKSNADWTCSELIPVIPGEDYVLSGLESHPNTGKDNYRLYDAEKNYIGYVSKNTEQYPIVFNSGVAYVMFSWKNTDKASVMFEQGSTASTYTPYVGQSYPVTFLDGETIYGGTLDAVNGVLTVAWAAKIVRGTDSFYASSGYIKSDAFDAFFYINDVYGSLGMCNMLKRSNAGIWGDVGYPNTFRINATQFHMNIANDLLGITDYTQETSTTATQKLKAWLEELYNNGTPLIVVYPISTPYEIPLSDIPVPVTLIGDNVIWTDTNGSNTIKYKKKG